jgi:hypothetical protein
MVEDGNKSASIDTSSEAWRAECEAQYIAKLPNPRRAEWLLALVEKRGAEATRKVEERVREILNEAGRFEGAKGIR